MINSWSKIFFKVGLNFLGKRVKESKKKRVGVQGAKEALVGKQWR